jgi:hypothetical protein
MKFKNLFLFAAVAIVASCGKYQFDATEVNKEVTSQNAKNQLGVDIDPNQDWKPIRQGSVTITANAPLENIVKVQVLTESPFYNEDALVLSTKNCQPGQQVTLTYEAPNYLTELVAACVNNKGVYYIKVFDINTTAVDFKSANVRTRAGADDSYPSEIILGSAIKSFNAERAEESKKNGSVNVSTNVNGSGSKSYTEWQDGSWANDRLWSHQAVVGGDWSIENGTIARSVHQSDQYDLGTTETYVKTYLKKYASGGTSGAKSNNWKSRVVDKNTHFNVNDNYVISDGTPIMLIPLQMWTTEGNYNSIYYYYYDPNKNLSADDIKKLPKFKAINGFEGGQAFTREKEYLLPYYGDNPGEGAKGSPVIPKGYRIGFLNRKDFNNKGDMHNCGSGCIYGDGNLNKEVNHLSGHYLSAMNKSIGGNTNDGMDWNSPRIGIFSANNHNYLCFEDGADCNFSDMIIEIKQGTEIIEETVAPEVEGISYTMCFEDKPQTADYDMNDVVLIAERQSETEVKLTVFACGAQDVVTLHGTKSPRFDNQDIHKILNMTEGQYFVNTKADGDTSDGVYDIINIGNLSIVEYLSSISIKNEVTGIPVRMPQKSEAPNAIIIPMRFNYPLEGISIKKAYPEFTKWASNKEVSKDWYKSTEGSNRFQYK